MPPIFGADEHHFGAGAAAFAACSPTPRDPGARAAAAAEAIRRRTTASAAARGASRRRRGRRPSRRRGQRRLARRIPAAQPCALRRRRRRSAGHGPTARSSCGRSLGARPVWLVFTSIAFDLAGQRGVVTRFGRYSRTLGPGVGLTLPSPIDRVKKIDVENIRSVDLGSAASERSDADRRPEPASTSPIRCAGTSARPSSTCSSWPQPDETIREVAESAMRAVVSQVTPQRRDGRPARRDRSAGRARTCSGSSTPIAPASRSRASPSSRPTRRTRSTTPSRKSPPPSRRRSRYINKANAYALQLRQKAQGEATAFDKVYEQYKLAPDVTRRRMYYETMEQVLSKVDKTIVEAPGVTPYLPLPQVQKRAAAAGAAAMTDFVRRRPLLSAIVGFVLLVLAARQLPDRARDQAGGRRPLRQAGADPQPLQARPADRRGRRRHRLAHPVRRADRLDRQARPGRRHGAPAGAVDRPAPARGRRLRPLPDRRSAADVHPRRAPRSSSNEQLRPILGSEVRNELGKRPFASLLTPERAGRDGQRPHVAQPDRPPIWRRDHRRPDQAAPTCPTARRSQSAFERMRTAREQEARSIRAAGRQAGADHPRRGRRRSRARPMPRASARTRNSTISTGRCRATRRPSSATAGQAPRRRPSFCRRTTTI